jgi:hypothetical protein
MARINTYSTDTTVQKDDKLLGSNVGGATRNFSIEDISTFQANTNATGIVGQIPYVYHNNSFGGNSSRQSGSLTTNTSNASTSFSAITTVKVSKFPYGNTSEIVSVIESFLDKGIIIARNDNHNHFGVYTCTAVTQDSSETNFYDLTLTYKNGNGSLQANEFYSILLYSGAQDKDHRHNQTSASSTWVINHNLNKYPNVTAFDSAGSQAIGSIVFNSKNQLTITFSASFSGTAYVN